MSFVISTPRILKRAVNVLLVILSSLLASSAAKAQVADMSGLLGNGVSKRDEFLAKIQNNSRPPSQLEVSIKKPALGMGSKKIMALGEKYNVTYEERNKEVIQGMRIIGGTYGQIVIFKTQKNYDEAMESVREYFRSRGKSSTIYSFEKALAYAQMEKDCNYDKTLGGLFITFYEENLTRVVCFTPPLVNR